MARETVSFYDPRQKAHPVSRPATVRSVSRVVAMSNTPTRKLAGNRLRRQLTQHFRPTRRGHRLILDSSGTASGGSPLGKCATVRKVPSQVLRWRIVRADPSTTAAAAPREVCLQGLTPPPSPFLTRSPSHLPRLPARHSLVSNGRLAVVECSQCAAAATIHRTAHNPKCAKRSWAVAVGGSVKEPHSYSVAVQETCSLLSKATKE